jgi:hypothetical protein
METESSGWVISISFVRGLAKALVSHDVRVFDDFVMGA